jgi:hypothetical protein
MGEVTVSARGKGSAARREGEKNAGQHAACRFFSAPRSTWDALWDEIVFFPRHLARTRGWLAPRAAARALAHRARVIGKRGGPSARRDGAGLASR